MLPVVGGVALASHGSAAFAAAGVALALGSNLGFSARAVCAKALYRDHPGSRAATSDACLFYHVSLTGLLLLLPVALLSDARVLASALAAAPPAAAARLVLTLAANGAAHALYNGVSFAMLAQVRRRGGSVAPERAAARARPPCLVTRPSPPPCPPQVSVATHSVLNIARRVVMIAVTAAAFGTHISPLNWCGVGVTAVGFAAFATSKRRGPPPRRRRTDAGLSPV